MTKGGRAIPETLELRVRQRTLRLQNRALLKLAKSESLARGDLSSALREMTEISARILATERVSVWFFSDDRSGIRCGGRQSRICSGQPDRCQRNRASRAGVGESRRVQS